MGSSARSYGAEIGLGEQAVVGRSLLHAHDDRALGGWIPVAGFLVDDAALFKDLGLTADFVCQAVMQVLEAVHVLQLGLGAELRLSAAAKLTLPSQRSEPSSMEQSEMPIAK